MDVRRRNDKPSPKSAGEPLKPHQRNGQVTSPKASDALPLPLYITNGVFFTLFFSVAYFLLHRWREKIRNSMPLHIVTLSELAAVISLIASVIYLLVIYLLVPSLLTGTPSPDSWDDADLVILQDDRRTTKSSNPSLVAKWVMHEYRLHGDFSYRHSFKEEWVLCRIIHRTGETRNAMFGGQSYLFEAYSSSATPDSLPPLLESETTPATTAMLESQSLYPIHSLHQNPFLIHSHHHDIDLTTLINPTLSSLSQHTTHTMPP